MSSLIYHVETNDDYEVVISHEYDSGAFRTVLKIPMQAAARALLAHDDLVKALKDISTIDRLTPNMARRIARVALKGAGA